MTRLHELFERQGQSPWLDNLQRSYLTGGRLKELVGDGIRGITSNPTIFAKAIEGGDDYDRQFLSLVSSMDVESAYWEMAVQDIVDACNLLRPVHDASGGVDGFVSIEVSPELAHDTAGTVEAARSLHARVDRPNVFVKIPATPAGIPAIGQMIAEGRNINVTLIFGLDRYEEVVEAYLSGLESLVSGGGDPSRATSVASFFVSRVDTNVDRRLEDLAAGGAGGALALRGKAAIAQAKLAYQIFLDRFSGTRWDALASKGARVQRPLWASTSTKNPAYPDLDYVDNLVGPDTVNTMPEATIGAFLDHGRVERTVDSDVRAARSTLVEVEKAGVDLADVSRTLEDEGVASFSKSFEELLEALRRKSAALRAGR